MLQIQNIKKQYKTGYLIQQALDNVSLSFRDSEFVSILGPAVLVNHVAEYHRRTGSI